MRLVAIKGFLPRFYVQKAEENHNIVLTTRLIISYVYNHNFLNKN